MDWPRQKEKQMQRPCGKCELDFLKEEQGSPRARTEWGKETVTRDAVRVVVRAQIMESTIDHGEDFRFYPE